MRLAIALVALLLAAAPAGAQTISVTGSDGRITIATADFPLRAVLEGSPALNVHPEFAGLSLGEGCRFAGVPAFNPIGAPFRYSCTTGGLPDFHVTSGPETDIVLKRNQGPNDSFAVTASLGAGDDTFMFAGPGLAGGNTVDGGSGRDALNYTLCTCPDGVTAALGSGFEAIVGSPGPDTLTGLPEGATADQPQLEGGAGNDTITTVNGVVERVFCGPGNDHAIADVGDSVGADCERVDRLAGAPVIGAGPSGIVGTSSATFEFALVGANPPPGHFECALDGAVVHALRVAGRAERAGRRSARVRGPLPRRRRRPRRSRGAALDGGHRGAAGDLRRRSGRRGQPRGSADRVPLERAGRGDVPVQPRCRAGGRLLEPASADRRSRRERTASRCRPPIGPATCRCRCP